MKCIRYIKRKNVGSIVRVSNEAARIMVETGIGEYTQKAHWKQQERVARMQAAKPGKEK